MEHAENNDFLVALIEFMDDDIGETGDDPFVRARRSADVAKLWKLAEPIRLGKNVLYNARGSR